LGRIGRSREAIAPYDPSIPNAKEHFMEPRLDFYKTSPDAIKAMLAFSAATEKLGLEKPLLELVKLRASQVNGCAFCVDMHAADARKGGETERRLYAVPVWRETPFFTPRERAALAWTEAVTRISDQGAPDDVYAALGEHFTPKEQMDLTLAISMINCWNRLAISFRKAPDA
jgi:AhpD family alkylhydroperoxidase